MTMKCPVCIHVDLIMTERNGVEIDYCPQCRGVWLDRGELDKIIDRSAAHEPPPQTAAEPVRHERPVSYGADNHHRAKQHEKKTRKKNRTADMLGAIFDS